MRILLAPSETKKSGGDKKFVLENLLFTELTPIREDLLNRYIDILHSKDRDRLSKMFGLKKEQDINYYSNIDILNEPAMKAIQRYTGVAFDYIGYESLDKNSQNYIDNNVILFSNLFGFLKADDIIPEYRLKQGEAIGEIKPEIVYKRYSHILQEYLKDEEILDLRATFYNKFYKPTKPYTTLKFIKNGKVVSHWAKAYRGVVLREIAKANIETIDEFMHLPIENLSIDEIHSKKNHTEIVYSID